MSKASPSVRAENHFLSSPSSRTGQATAALFMVAIVAVALMATVVEPASPSWRTAFGVFIVSVVLTTAVCGSVAVVALRERSWVVVIPTIVCLAIAANEVVQQVRAL